jgi:hypothetical protein
LKPLESFTIVEADLSEANMPDLSQILICNKGDVLVLAQDGDLLTFDKAAAKVAAAAIAKFLES